MGDRLRAGIPYRYVTSQLGQLSRASLRDRLIEYQLSAGVRAGMSPLPGVIPCGMWVPVAVWQPCKLLYTFFTYLLTATTSTMSDCRIVQLEWFCIKKLVPLTSEAEPCSPQGKLHPARSGLTDQKLIKLPLENWHASERCIFFTFAIT